MKEEMQVAINAQQKALMVKQQYKDKICKENVKVDFIDNNEYKAICNENQTIAQLKTKIDAKLAQIEQQKQAKRQQPVVAVVEHQFIIQQLKHILSLQGPQKMLNSKS